MPYKLNAVTGQLDLVNSITSIETVLNDVYVKKTGDIMTGELDVITSETTNAIIVPAKFFIILDG